MNGPFERIAFSLFRVALALGLAFGTAAGARAAVRGGPGTGGGLNNVTYIQRGDNLSNLLFNARSGMTYEFDTMTNVIAGKVPLVIGDVVFSPLKLSNVNDVTLIGKGNTVLSNSLDGMLFGIHNCTNILIDGFVFSGQGRTNSTTYDATNLFPHGLVNLTGTNDAVTFRRCVFRDANFYGLCASFNGGGNLPRTFNLHFIDCAFLRCGHTNNLPESGVTRFDGGAVTIHPEAVFEHCTVTECGYGIETWNTLDNNGVLIVRDSTFRSVWRRGVYFNGGAGFAAQGLVDGCTFIPDNAKRFTSSGHVIMDNCRNVTVQNCYFTNITVASDYAVFIDAGVYGANYNIRVIGNTFEDCNYAMNYTTTLGGAILNNKFLNCNHAIQFGADGALVMGNEFWDCGQLADARSYPIWAAFLTGTNCIITHNKFIRKTGTAPLGWILLDANQYNYIIRDNLFQDISGAVPYISDEGIGTRFSIGTGYETNKVYLGAGNGNTNYTLLPWFDDAYLGSSNVNVSAIMNTTRGWTRSFTVNVTNLSAINWGIGFSAVTNRFRFRNAHTGGTNAPTLLTNGTLTKLEIQCDGTNTNVRWHSQAHP